MKIIDISMKISGGMITYEGDPKVKIEEMKNISEDGVVVSRICMGLHSGTHVDAPAHYLKIGESIDNINLDSLIGRAKVCDLTHVSDFIKDYDLEKCNVKKGEILLLKTRNSELLKRKEFSTDFVYLNEDAADYLLAQEIKAVGVDYLSVEKFNSEYNYVHKKFLSNKIPIIEGLDLGNVEPGIYKLFCLPLKIMGGEAAPSRCILIK